MSDNPPEKAQHYFQCIKNLEFKYTNPSNDGEPFFNEKNFTIHKYSVSSSRITDNQKSTADDVSLMNMETTRLNQVLESEDSELVDLLINNLQVPSPSGEDEGPPVTQRWTSIRDMLLQTGHIVTPPPPKIPVQPSHENITKEANGHIQDENDGGSRTIRSVPPLNKNSSQVNKNNDREKKEERDRREEREKREEKEDKSNRSISETHAPDFKTAKKVAEEEAIKNGSIRPGGNNKSAVSKRKGFRPPFPKKEEEEKEEPPEKKPKTEGEEMVDMLMEDKRTNGCERHMIELILSELLDTDLNVTFNDIAGLETAKRTVTELIINPILRPDIFKGQRAPAKGLLLFGPPGTGKTLIAKAIASQGSAKFFSISASSLTSKWIGEGEKMVRTLFAVAKCLSPSIIFIDEIDSLLTKRNENENEASRRMKTEFFIQLDGAKSDTSQPLLVGATNRPQELDEAARRRLQKHIYIPLPEKKARVDLVRHLLKNERSDINEDEMDTIGDLSEGYSGADMRALVQEACITPTRDIDLMTVSEEDIRPVTLEDFKTALNVVKPTVTQEELDDYIQWNNRHAK
ncbi:fidgetin-like protein 1-like [Planoprotostelium fungivorum]|uniref:Fidgetin-like protein 1-like n=1 Tax=Planoprotostelium fungivorum TaxID=1890364 RepID=A0A2P6NIG2_9EUKA|nr:fidgetin-like protein 1-like [Planoprotostelium fungivorum]